MSEQQKTDKPKKDIFGFTKIGEDQYQSDEDPNLVMTAREFNGSLACALAVLLGVVGMVGGCTACTYHGVQRARAKMTQPAAAQNVARPINAPHEAAVHNQYQATQFHKQR